MAEDQKEMPTENTNKPKITAAVPEQQEIRHNADNTTEETLTPVLTTVKNEISFSKGDVKLQKASNVIKNEPPKKPPRKISQPLNETKLYEPVVDTVEKDAEAAISNNNILNTDTNDDKVQENEVNPVAATHKNTRKSLEDFPNTNTGIENKEQLPNDEATNYSKTVTISNDTKDYDLKDKHSEHENLENQTKSENKLNNKYKLIKKVITYDAKENEKIDDVTHSAVIGEVPSGPQIIRYEDEEYEEEIIEEEVIDEAGNEIKRKTPFRRLKNVIQNLRRAQALSKTDGDVTSFEEKVKSVSDKDKPASEKLDTTLNKDNAQGDSNTSKEPIKIKINQDQEQFLKPNTNTLKTPPPPRATVDMPVLKMKSNGKNVDVNQDQIKHDESATFDLDEVRTEEHDNKYVQNVKEELVLEESGDKIKRKNPLRNLKKAIANLSKASLKEGQNAQDYATKVKFENDTPQEETRNKDKSNKDKTKEIKDDKSKLKKEAKNVNKIEMPTFAPMSDEEFDFVEEVVEEEIIDENGQRVKRKTPLRRVKKILKNLSDIDPEEPKLPYNNENTTKHETGSNIPKMERKRFKVERVLSEEGNHIDSLKTELTSKKDQLPKDTKEKEQNPRSSRIPTLSTKSNKGSVVGHITERDEIKHDSPQRSSLPRPIIDMVNKDQGKEHPITDIEKTANLDEEFDKIFEDIIKHDDDDNEPTLPVELVKEAYADPILVENKFEEIKHAYDKNILKPIEIGKPKSKIPFLRTKSVEHLKEATLSLSRRHSLKHGKNDNNSERLTSDTQKDIKSLDRKVMNQIIDIKPEKTAPVSELSRNNTEEPTINEQKTKDIRDDKIENVISPSIDDQSSILKIDTEILVLTTDKENESTSKKSSELVLHVMDNIRSKSHSKYKDDPEKITPSNEKPKTSLTTVEKDSFTEKEQFKGIDGTSLPLPKHELSLKERPSIDKKGENLDKGKDEAKDDEKPVRSDKGNVEISRERLVSKIPPVSEPIRATKIKSDYKRSISEHKPPFMDGQNRDVDKSRSVHDLISENNKLAKAINKPEPKSLGTNVVELPNSVKKIASKVLESNNEDSTKIKGKTKEKADNLKNDEKIRQVDKVVTEDPLKRSVLTKIALFEARDQKRSPTYINKVPKIDSAVKEAKSNQMIEKDIESKDIRQEVFYTKNDEIQVSDGNDVDVKRRESKDKATDSDEIKTAIQLIIKHFENGSSKNQSLKNISDEVQYQEFGNKDNNKNAEDEKSIETDKKHHPFTKHFVKTENGIKRYRKSSERIQNHDNQEKYYGDATNLKKAQSLSDLQFDNLRGKVDNIIMKINSMEFLDDKSFEAAIPAKERPRERSVAEKIALFEGKRPQEPLQQLSASRTTNLQKRSLDGSVPSFLSTTQDGVTNKKSNHELDSKNVIQISENEDKIKQLLNAKSKYGCKKEMAFIELADGHQMPAIALGTAMLDPQLTKYIVMTAIDLGYRCIDAAYIYGNEQAVGDGIRAKIADGTVDREDLFIMNKLWSTFHRPDLVRTACEASLKAMGLDYFDLYMIHNPMSLKEGGDSIPKIANVLQHSTYDYLSAWTAMQDLVTLGLSRSIGVSNFNSQQLEKIAKKGRPGPVVNQVESHPYLTQNQLATFSKTFNISLSCYSVLGSPATPQEMKAEGARPVVEEPAVKELAEKLGVTAARLLIRYQLEKGRQAVVRASTPAHLYENLLSLDMNLTNQVVAQLDAMNRNKRNFLFIGLGETHKNYPFNIPF